MRTGAADLTRGRRLYAGPRSGGLTDDPPAAERPAPGLRADAETAAYRKWLASPESYDAFGRWFDEHEEH